MGVPPLMSTPGTGIAGTLLPFHVRRCQTANKRPVRKEVLMPKLVLTYFDFDGSRGEVARLALYIGGVAFEDRRIVRKDWAPQRDRYPFQALPVLEVDGKVIAQSNTI